MTANLTSPTGTSSSFVHVEDVVSRPRYLLSWERIRHTRAHWLVECVAEFMGVFFYCYAGVGATASMVIGNLAGEAYIGSLLQVGFGYALGIVLALTVCASTSGGHFNPCITISFALFKGFPWRKVPRFIISQILGAYVAILLVYLQWRTTILSIESILTTSGTLSTIQYTPSGPAGIFALYVLPTAKLSTVFANEFFVDFFIALVIWACLDPSNFFAPPPVIPYTIGFTYAVAIWGYAPNGLAANSARDVGGRLAAMTIWGREAAGDSKYAAIAALTNLVATPLAIVFYEFFFFDSSRVLPPAQRDFHYGHKAHAEHGDAKHGPVGGTPARARFSETASRDSNSHDKATFEHHA